MLPSFKCKPPPPRAQHLLGEEGLDAAHGRLNEALGERAIGRAASLEPVRVEEAADGRELVGEGAPQGVGRSAAVRLAAGGPRQEPAQDAAPVLDPFRKVEDPAPLGGRGGAAITSRPTLIDVALLRISCQ